MRLLLAMLDPIRAEALATRLYSRWEGWEITCTGDKPSTLTQLENKAWDLLLLWLGHEANKQVLSWLGNGSARCLPRVLVLDEPGSCYAPTPDCVVPTTAAAEQLCTLVELLAKKPLPHLAVQMQQRLGLLADAFLNDLAMPAGLKGRTYAAWLLGRLVPSRLAGHEPVGQWYIRCAEAFGTTAQAVERCLRVAVESVFTQGNMQTIERCFGATVDPEKGKPTNRVFLLKAAEHLRVAGYSLTDTRSLNSSEMHQSPAAPTSV